MFAGTLENNRFKSIRQQDHLTNSLFAGTLENKRFKSIRQLDHLTYSSAKCNADQLLIDVRKLA